MITLHGKRLLVTIARDYHFGRYHGLASAWEIYERWNNYELLGLTP